MHQVRQLYMYIYPDWVEQRSAILKTESTRLTSAERKTQPRQRQIDRQMPHNPLERFWIPVASRSYLYEVA